MKEKQDQKKCWLLVQGSDTIKTYSAKKILKSALELEVDIAVINTQDLEVVISSEKSNHIYFKHTPVELPDFVITRFGADSNYFSLAILRHLQSLGVVCINEAESIENVKDKLFTQQILASQNLPTIKTILAKYPTDYDFVDKEIGFPLVLKALSGSKGKGVYLCKKKKDLETVQELINEANPKMNLLLQKFIKSSKGKDLRAFVIGGKVVACMERKAKGSEFRANVALGGSVKNFEITSEIEWLSSQIINIFGLSVAGIDFLFDENGLKICEVNSNPGLEGIEKASKMNIASMIIKFGLHRCGVEI